MYALQWVPKQFHIYAVRQANAIPIFKKIKLGLFPVIVDYVKQTKASVEEKQKNWKNIMEKTLKSSLEEENIIPGLKLFPQT